MTKTYKISHDQMQ